VIVRSDEPQIPSHPPSPFRCFNPSPERSHFRVYKPVAGKRTNVWLVCHTSVSATDFASPTGSRIRSFSCNRPGAAQSNGFQARKGSQSRPLRDRPLANKRVENSHLPFRRRERAMLRFRRMKTLQKFGSIHANVHSHFNLERHLIDRQTRKECRSTALAEWRLVMV
jgi:hypothetical protein